MIRALIRLAALSLIALTLTQTHAAAADFIPPKRTDKCPVCGMYVYKYPQWVAEIVFQDGHYEVFDGSKDMLKFYFDMQRYGSSKTREDIATIYATEYFSNRIMRAEGLFFVLGSDVLGPMGHEFIPVKGEDHANTFLLEHRGNRILRFEEITPADIPD